MSVKKGCPQFSCRRPGATENASGPPGWSRLEKDSHRRQGNAAATDILGAPLEAREITRAKLATIPPRSTPSHTHLLHLALEAGAPIGEQSSWRPDDGDAARRRGWGLRCGQRRQFPSRQNGLLLWTQPTPVRFRHRWEFQRRASKPA